MMKTKTPARNARTAKQEVANVGSSNQLPDYLKGEAAAKEKEASHLVGALDDMEYHLAHWANRRDFY